MYVFGVAYSTAARRAHPGTNRRRIATQIVRHRFNGHLTMDVPTDVSRTFEECTDGDAGPCRFRRGTVGQVVFSLFPRTGRYRSSSKAPQRESTTLTAEHGLARAPIAHKCARSTYDRRRNVCTGIRGNNSYVIRLSAPNGAVPLVCASVRATRGVAASRKQITWPPHTRDALVGDKKNIYVMVARVLACKCTHVI